MVAYNFRKQLVPSIENGTKIHTIRLPRKNAHAPANPRNPQRLGGHALPGEKLQLYTGMRTKNCRLIIPDTICVRTIRITIELVHSWVDLYEHPLKKPRRLNCWDNPRIEMDPFARADGFENWTAMWDFFAAMWPEKKHRDPDTDMWMFDGFLIQWGKPEDERAAA